MGNGTIYRRGNSWCVGFTVEGRRVRETVGPNKKVAEKVLSLRMTQVLENRYFPPNRALGRMPFNQFADMYLERVVPLMKSIRTERDRVKRWIRDFACRPLGQITRAEVEAWRRERMNSCRPATINRDLSRLRHMLNIAMEWELLEKSPMQGMKFLRENNARTRYLSVGECHRLIDSCMAPHIRAIVTVALHTGMRLGEILNLRWQDLDFSSGFILVRDSKNGQARQVPMDSMISTVLRSWPRLSDDLYILKEILGHKSITMTQRYAHLSPTYKIKAIDRMNTLWAGAKPETNTSEILPEVPSVTVASQATYQDTPPALTPATDAAPSI